jgi:hypothetical protein
MLTAVFVISCANLLLQLIAVSETPHTGRKRKKKSA